MTTFNPDIPNEYSTFHVLFEGKCFYKKERAFRTCKLIFTVTKERASKHNVDKRRKKRPHSGKFIVSSSIAMYLKNANILE
jgi:hypothetical protein